MIREDLLKALELGEEGRIEYFEDLANLIEFEEYLDSEDVIDILKASDMETFGEICSNYFEEVLDSIPGDAIDIFTLLNNVKMSFMGLAANLDEEGNLGHLADELSRFRNWYSLESQVFCEDTLKGVEEEMTLRDALIAARLENIDGNKYSYDFSEALDYPIDEYIMSFADLISSAQGEEPLEDETDGLES